MKSQVAILRTRPETVVEDYGRLMRLVKYDHVLPRDQDLILKLNLSWTKYFPACSSQPWQVDGVLKTLVDDGYDRKRIFPVENKTVVTDPVEGCRNNKWEPVLKRHGVPFIPLPDVEWIIHPFKSPLLKLNRIFPEGIEIPKMYVGKNVLHMPTVKCVHPDTEILLANGAVVRAEGLVKEWQAQEPMFHLHDDDRVSEGSVKVVSLTQSGLGGARATHFWRTPSGPEVWAVRTRTGRAVTTSAVHPFLTPEGWVSAQQLRVGDRIAVMRHIQIEGESQPLPRMPSLAHHGIDVGCLDLLPTGRFGIPVQREMIHDYLQGLSVTRIARKNRCRNVAVRSLLRSNGITIRGARKWPVAPLVTSPEFWRWIGYFVAEGYAVDHHDSFRIALGNTDDGVRSDYINLCRSLFGITARCHGIEMVFYSNHFRFFLESLGFAIPTASGTKAVPPMLFRCPDAEIAAFIQAYLDGDGTVGHDGVHAITKSRRLAVQIQMLLSRLGVIAFVRTVHRSLRGGDDRIGVYFQLSVYGDDVVALAHHIKFRCPHKQLRLEQLVAKRERGKRPSHWDTVPVPRAMFRMVRLGLGLTRAATGRPSLVGNIEDRCSEVTRPVMQAFIDRFLSVDDQGKFANELQYMRFLASNDIAWDRVQEVRNEPADTPFLYDLSVQDTQAFIGNGIVLHNTHGHSITTGAIKNSFGGLLREVRHYAHEFMHEVLVDLMYMQRELHPRVFAVMDGTVMGDGAGPRTMHPRVGNVLLASADQVAIDAIAARLMGFDPTSIPYLQMCHERGLGMADPREIEIVGDSDVAAMNMGFTTSRSLVIWGDQLIRRGPLRPLKRLLLHSPLAVWAPFASNVYHDLLWYPTVGRTRIRAFAGTPWGRLFERY